MRVSTALFLVLLLALSGCSGDLRAPDKNAAISESAPPAGTHVLADAELRISWPEKGEVRASYHANTLNGGTESCQEWGLRVQWPPELRQRTKSETTHSGLVTPTAIGSRGQPTGVAVFNADGLTPAEFDRLVTDLKMVVRCVNPEGYSNTVIPTILHDTPAAE